VFLIIIFSGMIFRKEPFFQGQNNYDQLVKIARVLGTAELYAYLEKYGIVLDPSLQQLVGTHQRKPWKSFITKENKHLCVPMAIDLLDKLLVYDHQLRLSPLEAMSHPYFAVLKSNSSSSGDSSGIQE